MLEIGNKKIFGFIVLIIVCCFIVVALFTAPAFISYLNLSTSEKANIGSAIGGMTAPFVGIISSAFLYLALTKQIEAIKQQSTAIDKQSTSIEKQVDANKLQETKSEIDLILALFNNLNDEINGFYFQFEYAGNPEVIVRTGYSALNTFTWKYHSEYDINQYKGKSTFKNSYAAGQIAYLVYSFNAIEKRIDVSSLPDETKQFFKNKLNAYYDGKLRAPIDLLSKAFDKYAHQKDHYTYLIQDLAIRYKEIVISLVDQP